ncbi:MAG TPA: DUF1501 domain-containing protein [Gemmataceae bacterium]|nr:DUF1501 domain-containing protein [Gemmataceae bacterium]
MIQHLSRREWLKLSAAGVVGFSLSGWLGRLAAAAANDPQRKRSCILLWMNGGPSQMDTFDLKPGTTNGGPYQDIATAVPGIKISEHLPQIAKHADEMAIIRSMSTKEADHGRATYQMHTGRPPTGPIQYPSLGSLVAKELERDDAELPGFVSIAPFRIFNSAAYGPGFLGPQYAPLIVGENANVFRGPQANADGIDEALKVQDLDLAAGVDAKRAAARVNLLDDMETDFLSQRSDGPALSHQTAYRRAVTMMHSAAAKAFDLHDEPAKLRDQYGRNLFGQGCLLARRLVEQRVPFVEVTLANTAGTPGWDTHQNNFEGVKSLSAILDPAWATLMEDLQQRGLLETTLIVWMGEFGRTPKINQGQGRDHWANSWSTVLAGGGVRGGQVIGKTSEDGMEVVDRPVSTPDLLATIALALGLDPMKQNLSNVGRPIRFADPTAQPIKEVVA